MAAEQPTKLPQWATNVSRTLEPSAAQKGTGWEAATKPPARFMNWLFNLLYQWMQYLQSPKGTGAGAGVDALGGDTSGSGLKGTGGTPNGDGVEGVGTGTGSGVSGSGGSSSGAGVTGTGGSGGDGVFGIGLGAGRGVVGEGGATNAAGVDGLGAGSGPGVKGTGGATGVGVVGTGGSSSGAGVTGTGTAGNATGVVGQGQGSGDGVEGTGGSSNGEGVVGTGGGLGTGVSGLGGSSGGTGVVGTGGGSNGVGVAGIGKGTGDGVQGAAGATGDGVQGTGGTTSGPGGRFTASAGNSDGVIATGQGSGDGITATGGATGDGVHGVGTGGHGVVAESDTTSPAKSALLITPQDTDPSTPVKGSLICHDGSGGLHHYDGSQWGRIVRQVSHQITSSAVVSTSSETAFDKSYTIPANSLAVGDSLRFRASLTATNVAGGGNLTWRVRWGGVGGQQLGSFGGYPPSSGRLYSMDFKIYVVSLGGSGSIRTVGFCLEPDSATLGTGSSFTLITSTIDTTAAADLVVTAQWAVASANNSCYLADYMLDVAS